MRRTHKLLAWLIVASAVALAVVSFAPWRKPRSLEIEFLYLDLSTCTRCRATEANIDAALAQVASNLAGEGVEARVRKIHVRSVDQARRLGFVSSPTIRIDGGDIQLHPKESRCESCGELCNQDVDCRVWTYKGKDYTAAPKEMIVDAILKAVSDDTASAARPAVRAADVPENLKKFFAAKRRQGCGCCPGATGR